MVSEINIVGYLYNPEHSLQVLIVWVMVIGSKNNNTIIADPLFIYNFIIIHVFKSPSTSLDHSFCVLFWVPLTREVPNKTIKQAHFAYFYIKMFN